MNRRHFLRTGLALSAAGLFVPEWLLDPPKGRSMVAVPGVNVARIGHHVPLLVARISHRTRIGHHVSYFGGGGLFRVRYLYKPPGETEFRTREELIAPDANGMLWVSPHDPMIGEPEVFA